MPKKKPKKSKQREADATELFNGRCQMVVSSLYLDADSRAQACAKRFFDDYKKIVPKERFVESLSLSLEVLAESEVEDGRFNMERMEKAEEEVASWIKHSLRLQRRPRSLRKWREYACKQ